MIELCARVGYQNVSVAQVSATAGVSSATFYQQFDGKEACLLAAFGAARARVYRQMRPVTTDTDWATAARESLAGLFAGLQADPDAGRLVFVEALAGGAVVRAERERALAEQERLVRDFLESRPEGTDTLDIPVAALEGARRYIVSSHLRRHGEDRLPALLEDWISWIGSYARPSGQALWSTGPEALLAASGPTQAETPGPGAAGAWPARLPRGRHGLPASVVARSQRTRIIGGTAEVMMAKGYANATVADIVAAAGVSRDVFYEHFEDKQNAFLEAQQFATQEVINRCAAAYFSATDWPLRVWNALGELLKLIAEHPAIAHLRIVECYAAGASAIRIAEEIMSAASIFLEEGFSYRPEAREAPRLSTKAITGAILEVVHRHVASGNASALPGRLPQLTYIALAPFTGAEEAIRLTTEARAAHQGPGGSR